MPNFVVYKSSAGSGKTFTLVKEYLRLALFDEKKLDYSYKRILAVTFTNKAAAEMKERVISALNGICNDPKLTTIGALLMDELNLRQEELKRRAEIVLSSMLHHYSDLSIGTIDSFTHKIVKTFAHDLQLPVNFNIETDSRSFYEKVVSALLGQVGEDEYISRLLKEYVLLKAEDNSSWDPEQQILDFSGLLQKEEAGQYTEKLKHYSAEELEAFRKQFLDFKQYYKQLLKTDAQKAIDLIRNSGLTDDDFLYKGSGPQSFFRKCLDTTVTLENTQKGRIIDAVNSNKWLGKESTRKDAFDKIYSQLNSLATTLLEHIRVNHTYYLLCDALGRQMYPLMLLKKIEEISQEKKAEDKLVFISEFNNRIFDMVNNEPTPFIYERLGERYHHYLLDEFQDTSSLQWQNLLPLVDNSLSNGWFNLVVGDGKQSIYRWRNANVRQFAALPEIENKDLNGIVEERAGTLKRNFEEKLLDTNYRSLKTIVEFNNSFFGSLSETLLSGTYKEIYRGQAQKVKAEGEGYITIDTNKVEKDGVDPYTCGRVKQHIEQALESGFDHRDICVLVRRNFHGNTIASFLVENKIPVVSSDSLLLKNNTEINTIICYLAYLVNNRDTVSAAAVMNYLFQSGKITEKEYHQSLKDLAAHQPLFKLLERHGIELRQDELSLNNLFDNCIEIIQALELNTHAYHYLRFFLDEVNEFLVLKNSGVSAFFDWWTIRRENASMIIPSGTNAVKVMTIHASKGLEFPVVITPYCNWPVHRTEDSWVELKHEKVSLPVAVIPLSKGAKEIGFEQEVETENDEQTLDNLNLLYVAFTRAVERLHIITTASVKNTKPGVANWIKDFAAASQPEVKNDYYETGNPGPKQSQHKDKLPENFDLAPLQFDTPKDTVRIKAAWLNNSEEAENAKRLGINMHRILSMLQTEQDLDKALYTARIEGLITTEEEPALKDRLYQVMRHPLLASYFSKTTNSKLEAELITQEGELLRPDRIVFDQEGVVIIDYKTGKENTRKYTLQVLKYQQALMDLGHKNIKKLLVYLDEMQVVELK